jgi:type I restriction enzyme S subunit
MTEANNSSKDTELGPIPVEWEVVPLREAAVLTRKPRGLNLSDYEAIPFIPMELVPDNGTWIEQYELKPGSSIRSGTYCEKGDILLAKITPSFENGKQGIFGDLPLDFAYATTEVYPIRAKSDRLDQMFLFHFLRLPNVRADIAGKMEGSTGRQRVPKAVIENYLIPLPPLPEQRRIAYVLSTIQRAIAAQDDLIAAAREVKRSLMQRLFTYGPGPEPTPTKETRFGQVPQHWRVMSLEKCAFVQTGAAKGRRFGDSRTVTVPYLRVANVQDGYLDLSEIKQIHIRESEIERYGLQPGDVVLTEGGDFDKLGRGFIWRGQIPNCIHQNHIFAVRANREILLPEYLAYLVQSDYGKSYFLAVAHRTTHLACINTTKLRAFPTLVPDLSEQEYIASLLSVADRKIEAEEQRKAALQALFKAMLHQLMTGQVRASDTVEVLQ